MKCYVSENGLPRAVATVDALPPAAFVGYLCYVEETDAIYRFDGTEYAAVSADGGGENALGSTVLTIPTYSGKSSFPENPTTGTLAFSTNAQSKGAYVFDGTDWEQLSVVSQ